MAEVLSHGPERIIDRVNPSSSSASWPWWLRGPGMRCRARAGEALSTIGFIRAKNASSQWARVQPVSGALA